MGRSKDGGQATWTCWTPNLWGSWPQHLLFKQCQGPGPGDLNFAGPPRLDSQTQHPSLAGF